MHTLTPYLLMSEDLRARFGEIYVDTTYQDRERRIGFLRRASDKAILTYHVVRFDERGIRVLGKSHDEIVCGGLLGEVVKRSGIPHQRKDTEPRSRPLPRVLADLFGTQEKACRTKVVTYTILGEPYAHIQEFYNPRFTPRPAR